MKSIFLLLYLSVLGIFDWRERRVPVFLLVAGLVVSAAGCLCSSVQSSQNPLEIAMKICFGMVPGIFLLVTAWLTRKIGWGDGVALLTVGLAQGFQTCVVLLCLSLLLMALVCIALLLLRRVGKQTALPYLPFLALTYLAGMFM